MGVCIAFNVEELYKCLYTYNDFMFNRVFYDFTKTLKNDEYLNIVKNYFETGKIDYFSSEKELIRHLIYAGNLHKHKSFKNENEVRITTMDNNKEQDGTRYSLEEIGNAVKKVLIIKPDIMGQLKGTCFEKLIDEVIIGPRSQQNINVLQQYILQCNLPNLAEKIVMSDCPLR